MTRIAITHLLLVMAAIASVLVGSAHFALADNINKNNIGINIPTETDQKQVCKTTGQNAPLIGGSCTAGSSNTITESGGDITPTQGAATKTTTPTTEFLTFVECSGTNGNHNVHCTVHDSGITDINCNVANPAISGGNNVGDCLTNNGVHLTCVIPPQPGLFPCTRP
jgi:hypothetical protein